jgi:ankyrin repeat protein
MLRKGLLTGVCVVCMSVLIVAAPGDVRLADAAMQGDMDRVRSLLEQTADVNGAQGDGMTALHWAVYKDDLEMARLLIQAGADFKAGTRVGAITPLSFAAKNGNGAIIELLLNAGADTELATGLGTTPLMQAAASGSVDAVTSLLDHGAVVNRKEAARQQTAVMFAAALDRAPVVSLLASRGADLDVTSKIVAIKENFIDEDGNPVPAPSRTGETRPRPRNSGKILGTGGMSALHYAARQGHMASVRALVEAGANVNRVNAVDKTSPMLLAINVGRYEIAKYLLDNGADSNIASTDGLAPLYALVHSKWAPVAWTPTLATSASGIGQEKVSHLELMKALLDSGADPNATILASVWFNPPHHKEEWEEVSGTTAFWRAAQATDFGAMKLLVAYGADPKIPSDDNLTPLAVAAGIGWAGENSVNAPDDLLEVAKYMVEQLGLDVNVASDEAGFTALMGAAWKGDNELVQYLVDKGARVDVRTKLGWAVTDMANGPSLVSSVPRKHPTTIALLEKLGAPEPIQVVDEEILGIIKGRRFDPVTGQFVKVPREN